MTRSAPTGPSTATSRTSSAWCATADLRVRAHRAARPSSPPSTPRLFRALVVRGARSGWNGCCARCPNRCAGRHPARCPGQWIRRCASRIAAQLVGFRQDWQVWAGDQVADLVRLSTEVVETALSTVDKALGQTDTADAGLRRRPDPARNPADGVQRLAVHGQQGLRGRLRRYRAHLHAHATREIAGALASGRRERPNGWPRAGTRPTGCSARWMRSGCRDEGPAGPRACVSAH